MDKKRKKRLKYKKLFNKKSNLSIPLILAITSTLLFCITQLAINANLNPLGAKLESLNREKKQLIEENRRIEEEIAQAKSLKVITYLAEKKLNIEKEADYKVEFLEEYEKYSNLASQN